VTLRAAECFLLAATIPLGPHHPDSPCDPKNWRIDTQ